ncbi:MULTISPECIES: hypothetical protein [Prauserella]|uniref:Uncharacterized protein n=1 Tax=Prauserella endophytica TaxID=1592324 RepID=A0ABY2RWM1_9PSEU|nr:MULTISPECIES: hypothetical protein [Prauserella]TKG63553.1 hypothetical protein FCN18_30080 [Prauserella endophytica]
MSKPMRRTRIFARSRHAELVVVSFRPLARVLTVVGSTRRLTTYDTGAKTVADLGARNQHD